MPSCASKVAALGEDVWLEVWHLSYDGRQRPPRQRPKGWSDFLDHGPAGWWYIHAPGSGIFYHAGRTLAAPSKAMLLRQLIEQWSAIATSKSSFTSTMSNPLHPEVRRLVKQFVGDAPLETAKVLRKLEAGVPCRNVSWGRWRCVGDFVPSDNWDPLLIGLGRALGYDSLMLTATMWGRALGSHKRLLALAQGRPPPDEPPPRPSYEGELSAEVVDLRLPRTMMSATRGGQGGGGGGGGAAASPPLLLPDYMLGGSSAKREAMASEWAASLLEASPPRLSLRDPFRLHDESRAVRCDFNASGGPTVRLACDGHISWEVRDETQHQQTCTRKKRAAIVEKS